jgi:hypothetical protein
VNGRVEPVKKRSTMFPLSTQRVHLTSHCHKKLRLSKIHMGIGGCAKHTTRSILQRQFQWMVRKQDS